MSRSTFFHFHRKRDAVTMPALASCPSTGQTKIGTPIPLAGIDAPYPGAPLPAAI
jgi:hypothetical protein